MKIIHFADLHLGVETYGRTSPETGLSSRLEDYLNALDRLVDYAIGNQIDLVVFCGDAYKTREPTQTQQREFAKRIKRLSDGGVPLFLLIGNHDLPNALGRATTIEIFDTLSIPGVIVANRPGVHKVQTKSGIIQIAALPWVRRSALLNKEDSRSLNFTQLNERLQEALTRIIVQVASQLDPTLPSILAAHVWVLNASIGSEKSMSIGQEHMLLLGNVALPAFDYVALGHIHKGQVLKESPPTIYSGSLERLDFGDENDDKGFYLVEINETKNSGSRKQSDNVPACSLTACARTVKYRFQSIDARRFFTMSLDIEPNDPDPTSTVLQAIDANENKIQDAVTRIDISIPATIANRLRDSDIRNKIKNAYYLTISKDVRRETRLRMGKGALEGITPEQALKAYLESKYTPERAKVLLEQGEKMIKEHR
jgi:DNA repair protein SbcD/Mre11